MRKLQNQSALKTALPPQTNLEAAAENEDGFDSEESALGAVGWRNLPSNPQPKGISRNLSESLEARGHWKPPCGPLAFCGPRGGRCCLIIFGPNVQNLWEGEKG